MSICFLPHSIGRTETMDANERFNAQRLWKYMTVEEPYHQYPAWPGKEGFYESTMPPGKIFKLYINNLSLDTAAYKKGLFPYGSLLIKEVYTDDKRLSLITVMYKEKGFNPEEHDWYWVKYKPGGNVQMEGKVKLCIECHEGMAENDYVFTGLIK